MIICAYPGSGKSDYVKEFGMIKNGVIELHNYKENHTIRYVKNVIKYSKKYDYVLLSTHKRLLDELSKINAKFVLVYPELNDKFNKQKRSEIKFLMSLKNCPHIVLKNKENLLSPLIRKDIVYKYKNFYSDIKITDNMIKESLYIPKELPDEIKDKCINIKEEAKQHKEFLDIISKIKKVDTKESIDNLNKSMDEFKKIADEEKSGDAVEEIENKCMMEKIYDILKDSFNNIIKLFK